MDDVAGLAHGVDRGRALAVPDQIGIAIVLEDRHAILLRQSEHLGAARLRQDRAGRVLHRRDGVDVFWRDAVLLELSERFRQRVDPDTMVVERDTDRVDT